VVGRYYPFGLTMAGISDKALKSQYAQNKYRYNGKELQNQEFSDGSGLEEYDFGARFQDPQLGRFFNQDRFCEKLYSLSPYQFAANDPLLFVDNNGDSLIVADLSKDNAATDKFKKLSDKSLGGYYTTKVDKEGNVTLEKTDKKGDMTKEQKAFYDNLSGIVDPSKAAVTVGLVQGSNDVLVGSYSLGEIDVDDVEKFEGQIGVTAGGALIHELVEQQTKQLGKLGDNATDYEKAHETGIQAENKVNGSTRGAQGGALKQDIKGQTGAATVNYTQNGNNIKVTLNVVNGNVTSVTSKIENPKKK